MPDIKCRRFEGCEAVLCPTENNPGSIWYSDEEICKLKKYQTLRWIRRQKAVVRKGIPPDTYFNVLMLNSTRQIRKGTEGINPDLPLEKAHEAESVWVGENKDLIVREQRNKKPLTVCGEKGKKKGQYQTIKSKRKVLKQ